MCAYCAACSRPGAGLQLAQRTTPPADTAARLRCAMDTYQCRMRFTAGTSPPTQSQQQPSPGSAQWPSNGGCLRLISSTWACGCCVEGWATMMASTVRDGRGHLQGGERRGAAVTGALFRASAHRRQPPSKRLQAQRAEQHRPASQPTCGGAALLRLGPVAHRRVRLRANSSICRSSKLLTCKCRTPP